MQPDLFSKNKGYTLIEVLIVLVIFSVGILATSLLQTAAINGNSSAMGITDSTQQASDIIENIIIASDWTDGNVTDGNHSETYDGGRYTATWTVGTNATIGYKTIDMTITRFDRGVKRDASFYYIKPQRYK